MIYYILSTKLKDLSLMEKYKNLLLENDKGDVIVTKEIYLPKILKDLGLFKSTSAVRRNRPELDFELELGYTIFDSVVYETQKRLGWDIKQTFPFFGKKKIAVYIWKLNK